jgi:Leucine-rich repeat (LRR) protein
MLPTLPNSIIKLYCSNNNLTSLPALPPNLYALSCYKNKLISLPVLPNSLQYLYCKPNSLPDVFYERPNEPRLEYINRVRQMQKSKKNIVNTVKSHATLKKRQVFGNKPHPTLPVNVKREIAKYMDDADFENVYINSLKPKTVKKNETKKKH